MKGFKLAAAAGAVAMSLSAVGAAKADNQITFNLLGTVGTVCGVFGDTPNNVNVGFGDLGTALTTDWIVAPSENVHYICNGAAGFDRDITSDNSGVLVHQGGSGNTVVYEMTHSNAAAVTGLGFGYTQLTSAMNDNFDSSDFSSMVDETVTFRARGVVNVASGQPVVAAGDYADVVTVAITSN